MLVNRGSNGNTKGMGEKRENFKQKRATAGYQLSSCSTKQEMISEVF